MKLSEMQSYKIQMLRGIAIIAVVLIHNSPSGLAQVFIRPFLNFSVGLFLFLSGMLSNAKDWNPKKRIVKVAIPYAIWSLIYIFFQSYDDISQIPIRYLKSLVLGNASVMTYYVLVYCEFTMLIPLIDKLSRSRYRYWGVIIAPIEIVIMRLLPLVMNFEMNKYLIGVREISCLGWFSYYYLGYLLGNNYVLNKSSTVKLIALWFISIVLQMLEGYWYFNMGEINCGTALKLSAILSGTLFVMLAFRFVNSNRKCEIKVLKILGDMSFGIYFSHAAVMGVLCKIPYYTKCIPFPINAVIVIIICSICINIGKMVLGKQSKYLAL